MFYDILGGVTKLEAFQCSFVTKLYPPKPSPFFKIKMKMSRSNLLRSRLAFLETFHIGSSNPRGKQHAQKGLPYGGLQSQGAAACPEGNSMHVQGEQYT
jgi:hypothetical protein